MFQPHLVFLEVFHGFPRVISRQQNDLVFNVLQWPIEKICQVIWDALQDYDRIEWQQTPHGYERDPRSGLPRCAY